VLAPSGDCGAQAFLGQVAPVGVQPIKVGDLNPENLLHGLSVVNHSARSVKVRIIRSAWPWRESSPNKLDNLLFEAMRVVRNFLGELLCQLSRELLNPVL
jgi:hypothetical protein